MDLTLYPRRIGGTIRAIASKSQAHRLLICAAFAEKATKIICSETSQDIEATARCMSALGAHIDYCGDTFTVYPLDFPKPDAVLDCGESGSTLRFLLPVVAALGVSADFVMHGRLPERPLSPLWELLEENGIIFSRPSPNVLHMEGKLRSGCYHIAGDVSSQFISGLLFALPLTGGGSEIMLTSKLESAPYVDMTLRALALFGIQAQCTEHGFYLPAFQSYRSCGKITVEGDWSNAAFWLCSGAICAPMQVTGLDLDSAQGDRKILEVLERFGAKIEKSHESICVSPQELSGIDINASDIPDLVPPMALVASCARGKTRIFGAQRLRIKESDRLMSVSQTLNRLGGKVEVTSDGLIIEGAPLCGGTVNSQNDHRIAMMSAIASTVSRGSIVLEGAEAVKKSYPRFWDDFRKLVI
ncbi:MAG: 3-phosphoshikimate 1-carboxyvinyltransferase [Ruminococcaceae bacterium]|nr:3-phosphoshikimate 1-carboxyvinyltransferase [Oscillospiraceae bacterium]